MDNYSAKWYKTWWGIMLITVAFLILVSLSMFGFYVADLAKRIQNGEIVNVKQVQQIPLEQTRLIEGLGNYWLGTTTPKVTIVYFADFACPICRGVFTNIEKLGIKYKKDIKIIFRDFLIHEESLDLAMAARCAGEQGLFWPMYDKLFQFQGVKTADELTALAKETGVEINRFTSCFTSKKYLGQIQKNQTDGETLEISGTPTWFINGQEIAGDIPYDTLTKLIDSLLK